jgi:hypothetical protein
LKRQDEKDKNLIEMNFSSLLPGRSRDRHHGRDKTIPFFADKAIKGIWLFYSVDCKYRGAD